MLAVILAFYVAYLYIPYTFGTVKAGREAHLTVGQLVTPLSFQLLQHADAMLTAVKL